MEPEGPGKRGIKGLGKTPIGTPEKEGKPTFFPRTKRNRNRTPGFPRNRPIGIFPGPGIGFPAKKGLFQFPGQGQPKKTFPGIPKPAPLGFPLGIPGPAGLGTLIGLGAFPGFLAKGNRKGPQLGFQLVPRNRKEFPNPLVFPNRNRGTGEFRKAKVPRGQPAPPTGEKIG